MQIYENEISRLRAEVATARDGETELAGKLAAVEMDLSAALCRAGEAKAMFGEWIRSLPKAT